MALSQEDWANAALQALAEEGLGGIAVEPLARRLGTTKGSFYWHFANRDELIDHALQQWERTETDAVIAGIEAIEDPRERLVALIRLSFGSATTGSCDTALRAVAHDPRVRPALESVTAKRMAFLSRLYRDLGFTAEVANQHARLTYALFLGIGQLRQDQSDGAEFSDAEISLAVRTMLRVAGIDEPPGG